MRTRPASAGATAEDDARPSPPRHRPRRGGPARSRPPLPDVEEEIDEEEELWTDDSGEDYSGWYCVRTDPWDVPGHRVRASSPTSSPRPTW